MISRCYKGNYIKGCIDYLFGPGHENEHINQKLLIGSDDLELTGEINKNDIKNLTKFMYEPQKDYNLKYKNGYVMHMSLSLKENEGKLSNAKWSKIARETVKKMGFIDNETAANCRWFAMQHGSSKNGNDHIHIVVNMTRIDGSRGEQYRDYLKLMKVRQNIEKNMGLLKLNQKGIKELREVIPRPKLLMVDPLKKF
jgi:hypothetical protein